MLESFTHWLLTTFGLVGIGFVVFAESGLLVGMFFPGDSLLFTAGLFASRGDLPIVPLIAVAFLAAVAGDTVGYTFGRKAGSSLYKREDSRFFKQEHLRKATDFYERHGGKTIVIARFIPIVRTMAPIVAGAAEMKYRRFIAFNVIGGALWGIGVTLLGYFLGQTFPWIGENLEIVVIVIVAVSVIPIVLHLRKSKRPKSADHTAAEDNSQSSQVT